MWAYVAKLVFTSLISLLLRPKPEKEKRPELEDVELPVAEDGKPIPVIFGRRWVQSPNVVWYGDFRAKPIRRGGKKNSGKKGGGGKK